MNQPSKTDAHGRSDRINDFQRAQLSPAQDQVLSHIAERQYVAENNYQNLSRQYQHLFEIYRSQLLRVMNAISTLVLKSSFKVRVVFI